jgi:hypothetical protein
MLCRWRPVGRELRGSMVCTVASGGRRKKKMGRAAARLKKRLVFC